MDRTHALHRRWAIADRQQLGGEPDPPDRTRAFELAIRGFPASGSTRGRGDELDPVGQAQRARSVHVLEGRPAAPSGPAAQSRLRTAAALLGVVGSLICDCRQDGSTTRLHELIGWVWLGRCLAGMLWRIKHQVLPLAL